MNQLIHYDQFLEEPYDEADRLSAIRDVQIREQVAYEWDGMTSEYYAERLDAEADILTNLEGKILATIAYYRAHPSSDNAQWAMAQLIGLIDPEVKKLAAHKVDERA